MFSTLIGTISTLWSYPEFPQRPVTMFTRVAAWSARRRLGLQQRMPIAGVGSLQLALPTDGWSWNLFVFRENRPPDKELLWLTQHLQPGMVALDVGAHYGIWTAAMANAVAPGGRVLAFEPTPSTVEILKKTIALNRLSEVTVCQITASDLPCVGQIHIHAGAPDMNTLGETSEPSEEVQIATLDEVVHSSGLSRVDAIKIDTEGNEERLVLGGLQTLAQQLPIVTYEINPWAARLMGLAPQGAWDRLVDLGYRMHILDEENSLLCVNEFSNSRSRFSNSAMERSVYWNVIAIHPGRDVSGPGDHESRGYPANLTEA